jgi:uncharacterized protein YndB with AHSA1/START domain
VWQALTEPAALCAWFWPAPSFGTTAEVDLGKGFRIDAPKADVGASGRYVAVEPPGLLVMTWQWAGEDTETLVRIELAAAGNGTELTLVHEGSTDDMARDERHLQGWSDCLDRLPGWLANRPV